jgi:hypothetical protein
VFDQGANHINVRLRWVGLGPRVAVLGDRSEQAGELDGGGALRSGLALEPREPRPAPGQVRREAVVDVDQVSGHRTLIPSRMGPQQGQGSRRAEDRSSLAMTDVAGHPMPRLRDITTSKPAGSTSKSSNVDTITATRG